MKVYHKNFSIIFSKLKKFLIRISCGIWSTFFSVYPSSININGILALEIGTGQYISVTQILKQNGFREFKKIKDYKDNVRCIFSTLLWKKTKIRKKN